MRKRVLPIEEDGENPMEERWVGGKGRTGERRKDQGNEGGEVDG